jgi:multicomponent Na+:H+ antiporter subunit E
MPFIASGTLASAVSILASHFLFFQSFNLDHYHLPLKKSIPFLFHLLKDIYSATFHLIKAMMAGTLKPDVVKIHTKVTNPWHQCLVSNAITMTPGTVTIDKSDTELTVLWLTPSTEDPEQQAAAIQGSFEKALIQGEANE